MIIRRATSRIAGRRDHPECGTAFLILVLLTAPVTARADWILDASLGFRYDDNLSLGQHRQDREGGAALTASVSPGKYFQLNDRVGLSVAAALRGTRQFNFHRLDNVSAGLRAALRTKLGLGRNVPWLRLAAEVSHEDFEDKLRDGWRYSLNVDAGRRISERLSVQFGYSYQRRSSDRVADIPFLVSSFGIRGDAFSTAANSLSAGAVYLLNNRIALILGYARRMGTVTSTTHRNPEIFEASDAIAADSAFGPDRFAYRIRANANIFSVALNYALGQHASLDAGYRFQDAWSYEDIRYRNNIVHLQILYSY